MSRTIIHIGLHKTASTFLQKQFFRSNADTLSYYYNPTELFDLLIPIFEFECVSNEWLGCVKKAYQGWRRKYPAETLLLSSESFSQLLYTQNYQRHIELLADIFGEIEVILFFRNQVDWLGSVYKETLKSGDYQSFGAFIGQSGNQREMRYERFNENDCLMINPSKADWLALFDCLENQDGINVSHVFFYEDFRDKPSDVLHRLASILGPRSGDVFTVRASARKTVNKGISGGAIRLLIMLASSKRLFPIPTGYKAKYELQKQIMKAGPSSYLDERARQLDLVSLISREINRVISRLSMYRLLVLLDKIAPARFRDIAYAPDLRGVQKEIFDIHLHSNEELFSRLKRAPIAEYVSRTFQ